MKFKNYSSKTRYEHKKFNELRKSYNNLMNKFSREFSSKELVENFPIFAGELTLSRYFTLYEYYKKTKHLAGHICEVGTYRGASLIFLAKILKMFEKNSLTMIHGFDWFKGNVPKKNYDSEHLYKYSEKYSYKKVMDLINSQNLDNIIKLHKIDVVKKIDGFFKKKENTHIYFKFIFLDSGTYQVTKSAIKSLWKRLVPGGILVFDQLYFELAPGETRAKNELLSKLQAKRIPNSWMPNAYIIKK